MPIRKGTTSLSLRGGAANPTCLLAAVGETTEGPLGILKEGGKKGMADKAYKVRIYLKPKQIAMANRIIGCARWAYTCKGTPGSPRTAIVTIRRAKTPGGSEECPGTPAPGKRGDSEFSPGNRLYFTFDIQTNSESYLKPYPRL